MPSCDSALTVLHLLRWQRIVSTIWERRNEALLNMQTVNQLCMLIAQVTIEYHKKYYFLSIWSSIVQIIISSYGVVEEMVFFSNNHKDDSFEIQSFNWVVYNAKPCLREGPYSEWVKNV